MPYPYKPRRQGRRRYASFRRRRMIPDVRETRRWEATNFFYSDVISWGGEAGQNNYHISTVVLASIYSYYAGWPDVISARTMRIRDKRMLIGGIVLHRTIQQAFLQNGNPTVPYAGALVFPVGSVLYTDEFDGDDGTLSNLPQWTTNMSPVSTTPANDEIAFPTRVHQRLMWGQRFEQLGGTALTFAQEAARNAQGIQTHGLPSTSRIRLKAALSDKQALCLSFWGLLDSADGLTDDTFSLAYNVAGTIYWRLV